jgi:hypothetical protein
MRKGGVLVQVQQGRKFRAVKSDARRMETTLGGFS